MASLSDVAKKAGVSITTASFVLNGRSEEMRITPQTTEKVLKAVQELRYVPNISAKKLTDPSDRKASLPEVAIFWASSLASDFPGAFANEAQELFESKAIREMHLMVSPFLTRHAEKMGSNFLERHYNGLIFSPVSETEFQFIDKVASRIPCVVLHIATDKHPNVVIDHYNAGRTVASVFAAHKYGSACYVGTRKITQTAQRDLRYDGFRIGCRESDIPFHEVEVPDIPELDLRGERALFGRKLAQEFLAKGNIPRAFFIIDESMAVGFSTTLAVSGVRIPEDVAIVTYGNSDICQSCYPSISTLGYPMRDIVRESLNLLNEQLGNPFIQPRRVVVQIPMVFRESCPMPEGWNSK